MQKSPQPAVSQAPPPSEAGRAAAGAWLVPGIGPTPALRGFPGGPGLPAADDGPGGGSPGGAILAASAWQRARRIWLEAGVEWVREPGWLPERAWPDAARAYWVAGPDKRGAAGMDSDHTEPIPAVRTLAPSAPLPPVRTAATAPPRRQARDRRATTAGRQRAGLAGRESPLAGRRPVGMAAAVAVSAAVIALAVVITVTLVNQPASVPRPAGALPGYPPARVADAAFGASLPAGTGTPPVLATLAASGTTVVAVGAQAGPAGPQPVFLVSGSSGTNWRLASMRVPGGDVSGGSVPSLLTGGPGGWLALGRQATWVSAAGQVWHREPGIVAVRGDRVLSLARSATGYLAAGMNVPAAGPARATGVLWASADGVTWQRRSAGGAGLRAGAMRVMALTQVAAHGNVAVAIGAVAPAVTYLRSRNVPAPGWMWRSGDGGRTWAPVRLPGGHGAGAGISGVARAGAGFVLIRPGRTAAGQQDAVAFQSADGIRWRFAGLLTAAGKQSLRVSRVTGNGNGAVLTAIQPAGRGRGTDVAFVTGDGRAWHRVPLLGSAAAATLAGVAAGPGGLVVAAGSAILPPPAAHPPAGASASPAAGSSAGPVPGHAVSAGPGRQPFLLLAGPRHVFTGRQALARAASAGVTVTALASGGRTEVAAGSAAGKPAIWRAAAGGRWSADPVGTWAVQGLTLGDISYGNGHWLALGRRVIRHQTQIEVLTSADGRAWQVVPGPGALAPPGTAISQAAAGPGGYVMVGKSGVRGQTAAVAWWAATPGAWSQAAGTAVPGPSAMLAVTAAGQGFAAVGAAGAQPAVWSSADGAQWTPEVLPLPAGAHSAVLRQVASAGRALAAVGTETTASGPVPFAAVSGDAGRTWHEAPLPAPTCQADAAAKASGAGSASVSGLVAAGGRFVATGTCGSAGLRDVVVWSSLGGRGWTVASPRQPGLSGPGAQQITALTASGALVTGAGYTATPAAVHLTLWQVRVR